MHLLRLLTGEFLHFHVVPNQSRFGDQLLLSLFLALFHIELLNSVLQRDPAFQSVTRLVKQLDKLTHKNQEALIKAYFKFLAQVLPTAVRLLIGQGEAGINEQNDLLSLAVGLAHYFFDVRFSLKDVSGRDSLPRKQKPPDEDEEEEESEAEERKSFRLKMLYQMREKETKHKMWGMISGSAVSKVQLSNASI